eukprot:TRINITY_DN36133_c0_g1_i1.p1 TRINITY_DN36133_c0_g1~~TRINITY_DN36133_c0_g1_i1.p1  ORF type:complete len:323 (-),score=30.20 TRINITY_DN36133_c0_g1_i1:132-1100(-)
MAPNFERASLDPAKTFRVFCDLDGVLADFDRGVRRICNGQPPAALSISEMWREVDKERDFFRRLHWTAGGKRLWRALATAQRHQRWPPTALPPAVLTGLPTSQTKSVIRQKQAWCARRLGPDVQVICCWKRDKPRYCRKGGSDILIDDRWEAKPAWEAVGGVFVHYTGDVDSCLAQLCMLGAVDADATALQRPRRRGSRKFNSGAHEGLPPFRRPRFRRRFGRGRSLDRLHRLFRALSKKPGDERGEQLRPEPRKAARALNAAGAADSTRRRALGEELHVRLSAASSARNQQCLLSARKKRRCQDHELRTQPGALRMRALLR